MKKNHASKARVKYNPSGLPCMIVSITIPIKKKYILFFFNYLASLLVLSCMWLSAERSINVYYPASSLGVYDKQIVRGAKHQCVKNPASSLDVYDNQIGRSNRIKHVNIPAPSLVVYENQIGRDTKH